MVVSLSSGDNALVFRVGDDRSTAVTLHLVLQQPTPPASVAPPDPSPSPSDSAEPSESPSPTETPAPTPKPTPTPVVVTVEDTVYVSSSKTRLHGSAGTYTWVDVSFEHELGSIAWTAKAPAHAACRVIWRLTSDYAPNITFSAKPSAGKTLSGTRSFQPDYGDYQVAVTSTCASWSSRVVSKSRPPGWNPWGFNFTPGLLIYSPPSDFCSYFDCIASFWDNTRGYVMQCQNGMFSHSGGRSGSCSWHGGNRRPLYRH
jgi:hypothetical protein